MLLDIGCKRTGSSLYVGSTKQGYWMAILASFKQKRIRKLDLLYLVHGKALHLNQVDYMLTLGHSQLLVIFVFKVHGSDQMDPLQQSRGQTTCRVPIQTGTFGKQPGANPQTAAHHSSGLSAVELLPVHYHLWDQVAIIWTTASRLRTLWGWRIWTLQSGAS